MADLSAMTARLRAHLPGPVDADLQAWLGEAAILEAYPGGVAAVPPEAENLVVLQAGIVGCKAKTFEAAAYFSFAAGGGRQINKGQVSANYRALLQDLQMQYDAERALLGASQSLSRADGR